MTSALLLEAAHRQRRLPKGFKRSENHPKRIVLNDFSWFLNVPKVSKHERNGENATSRNSKGQNFSVINRFLIEFHFE